jgi:phosphate transport system permease protein
MIQSSLAKRRKEKAFVLQVSQQLIIGLAFVALLFGSILAKGYLHLAK